MFVRACACICQGLLDALTVKEVSGWNVRFYRRVTDREELTYKATQLKMKVVKHAMKWNVLVCGVGPSSEKVEAIQDSLPSSLAITPAQFNGLLERLMKEPKCTAASIETKSARTKTQQRKRSKKLSDDRPRGPGLAATSNRTRKHLVQAKDRGLIFFLLLPLSWCGGHSLVVMTELVGVIVSLHAC